MGYLPSDELPVTLSGRTCASVMAKSSVRFREMFLEVRVLNL